MSGRLRRGPNVNSLTVNLNRERTYLPRSRRTRGTAATCRSANGEITVRSHSVGAESPKILHFLPIRALCR